MDRIVSLSYNYGVTLMDLDQVALAERFVLKAVNLLRFAASQSLKAWLPRIQVGPSELLGTEVTVTACKHLDVCAYRKPMLMRRR